MCAELRRSLDPLGREINRHNAAPGGADDLDRQHPHKPRTNHRDRFADTHIRLPTALQRDRTNGSQTGRNRRHLRRNAYREISRNKVDLSMIGVPAAGASDAITHSELVHAVPHRNYFACAAISECHECIQICV